MIKTKTMEILKNESTTKQELILAKADFYAVPIFQTEISKI